MAVDDDSLDPGGCAGFGDAEVESVSVSVWVAPGLVEEASESGGGQFGHQSHVESHRMDGIVGDKLEAEGQGTPRDYGGSGLGSRGRIRTCDLAVNSRPLYH